MFRVGRGTGNTGIFFIGLMLDECYAYFIRKCLAFRFGKGSACNESK